MTTLPETNSSHLNIGIPKKVISKLQTINFPGANFSFGEGMTIVIRVVQVL